MSDLIEEIEIREFVNGKPGPRVRTMWRFRKSDPFAVEMTMFGSGESTIWALGRDLLAAGVESATPVGEFEVKVWRTFGPWLALRLDSPLDGAFTYAVPAVPVERLLRNSYILVPRGAAEERLFAAGFDATVARWTEAAR